MKKLLSLVLALALALSLSVTAFAASPITAANGTDTGAITATVAAASTPGTVYYVEVTWGTLEFTYGWDGAKVWNPSTLQYTDGAAGTGWTLDGIAGTDDKVTVTNKSNIGITTTLIATAVVGVTNLGTTAVTGLVGNDATKTLAAASVAPDTNNYVGTGAATTASYTLSLTGVPGGAIDGDNAIFDLTLSIA